MVDSLLFSWLPNAIGFVPFFLGFYTTHDQRSLMVYGFEFLVKRDLERLDVPWFSFLFSGFDFWISGASGARSSLMLGMVFGHIGMIPLSPTRWRSGVRGGFAFSHGIWGFDLLFLFAIRPRICYCW